jgi:hypothetical protein
VGRRKVDVTTSGHEKTKISDLFTACADGSKLPIYLIVPRKTEFPVRIFLIVDFFNKKWFIGYKMVNGLFMVYI